MSDKTPLVDSKFLMTTSRRDRCDEHEECVRLVFFGSPLLDITLECGPDFPEKHGLLPDGCVLATERHADLFHQMFHNSRSRLDSGGSALNSAKIAQWVLERNSHVAFAGCVGNDNYAICLKSELLRSGVEPLFITMSKYSTGICACLLSPGGKRAMCTRQGAAAFFSKGHLDTKEIREWLQTSDCIFVVGYFVAHSPEVVRALGDLQLPGQLFALSLSAEYICKDFKNELLEILPKVDILFANESEIRAFAVALGLEDSSTTEQAVSVVATLLRSRDSPRIVVVTRGPDPVIFVMGEDQQCHFPVPTNVPVLDTVGCGDALAGAFLAVYALTKDVTRAIRSGIQAAVEIAQVPGCSPMEKTFIY